MEEKIKGFLKDNPRGSPTEFFRLEGDTRLRSQYYRLRPKDYVWPGGGFKSGPKGPIGPRSSKGSTKYVELFSEEEKGKEKEPQLTGSHTSKVEALLEIAKMINNSN